MNSENLPIFKSALDLAVYMEKIVKGFDKYNKYTIGVDLRQKSKNILYLINRANLSKDKKEAQKEKMNLAEIKSFLSVQASFVSHIQHSNSFNLMNKVGVLDENNPFDYDRA